MRFFYLHCFRKTFHFYRAWELAREGKSKRRIPGRNGGRRVSEWGIICGGGEGRARELRGHTPHTGVVSCEIRSSWWWWWWKKKAYIHFEFSSSSLVLVFCSFPFSLTHSLFYNKPENKPGTRKKNVNEARDVKKKKEHREVKKEYLKTGFFFLSKWFQSNWIQMMLRRWWWGVREKMLCFFFVFFPLIFWGRRKGILIYAPAPEHDRSPTERLSRKRKERK